MRREIQPVRPSGKTPGRKTTGYTFYFQMTNKGGRQACSVKIAAPNLGEATTFFQQNWPMIESRARDILAKRSDTGRPIKLAGLVVPSMSAISPPHREGSVEKVEQALGRSCGAGIEAGDPKLGRRLRA